MGELSRTRDWISKFLSHAIAFDQQRIDLWMLRNFDD